jgi:hypothetical protein
MLLFAFLPSQNQFTGFEVFQSTGLTTVLLFIGNFLFPSNPLHALGPV